MNAPAKRWGGARAGAGRPKRGAIASEPHKQRPALVARQPQHVIARVVRAAGDKTSLEVRSVTRHGPGAVSRLVPPGDEVHAMFNPTERDTVEIHVYGRDLYGLPRKTWAADGTVKPLVSPKYVNC